MGFVDTTRVAGRIEGFVDYAMQLNTMSLDDDHPDRIQRRHHGAPGMSAYSASKAAVRNLARTWAEDLKGTGIRVNVLSPGATTTELAKAALGEEGQKVYASMTPLQRMADPAEIGAVAAFLASSDSSFMTASEVAVDGGLAQI